MTPLHIAVWAAARAAMEKVVELNSNSSTSALGADVAGDEAVVHCDTTTAAVLLGFDADPTLTDAVRGGEGGEALLVGCSGGRPRFNSV